MTAIARRYAKATLATLDDIAKQQPLLDEMRLFEQTLKTYPVLSEALHHPAFKSKSAALLAAVCNTLHLSQTAVRLIHVLLANHRLDALADVVQEIQQIIDRRMVQKRGIVRSAVTLTDGQLQHISQKLEKQIGQPVILSVQIDPSLLGGLVCEIDDMVFDDSLAHQLFLLAEHLGASRIL